MSDRPSLGRRTFLKGIGAAAGTGAGLAATDRLEVGPPVQEAQAVAPIVIGAAVAAGYVIGEVADYMTGDDIETDELADLGAAETHNEIYEKSLSNQGADDTVLTMLSNRLAETEHTAWAKGKKAAVEKLNNDATEADAEAAAVAAVEGFYAQIQKNLVNHYSEQANKQLSYYDEVANTGGLRTRDVWYYEDEDGHTKATSIEKQGTEDISLVDGSIVSSVPWFHWYQDDGTNGPQPGPEFHVNKVDGNPSYSSTAKYFHVVPEGSGDLVSYMGLDTGALELTNDISPYPIGDLYDDIIAQNDSMVAEVKTYVTDLYNNSDIQPGDIDVSNFLDPAEIASQYQTENDGDPHYGYAAAELAALGLRTEYNLDLAIDVDGVDETLKGQLFYDDADITVKVGTTYSPADFVGPVFMAYEFTDADGNIQTDIAELENSFTVVDAVETSTGNKVDEINSKEYITQTSDVTVTKEELDKIRDLEQEIQQQRDEILDLASANGARGGGGSSNPGIGQKVRDWVRERPAEAAGATAAAGGTGYLYLKGGSN